MELQTTREEALRMGQVNIIKGHG